MCLSPIRLKDRTQVACRHCSLCRANRLNDLIGRCIAEGAEATAALAVTLTYSGDGPETAALRYSDVQLFLKRLRKAGYSVRYIVAGEYGSKKGRSHWHIILFFRGAVPDVQRDRRTDWKVWPHGFVYVQNPDYGGFRYVLKYALKDIDDKGQVRALAMSKKPPLGHDFFLKLAERIVAAGLPIQSPEYAFSDVLDRKGVPRRYWLQGRMREKFLEHYCACWRETYGTEPPATDWLVERYLDPIAKREMAADPEGVQRDLERRQAAWLKRTTARDEIAYWQDRRELAILHLNPARYVVAWSTHTADLIEGTESWRVEGGIKSAASVGVQLQHYGLPKCDAERVWRWLNVQWSRSDKRTPPPLRPSLGA